MPTVRIAEKKVWVDKVSIPLLSGEVHYWRLDPANWQPVLRRVREMGLQVIATYVCWDFHEIEPGRYDFRGESDARRNLLRFLDMLTAEGFWVILRPGPYIYSEWRNNGVPDDALQMGLQAGTQYTIGYTEERGRGCLTMIGLAPSPQFLLALFEHLNVRSPSGSLTPQVSTALFRRDQEFYLFAVNDGDEDKIANVVLDRNLVDVSSWRTRNLVSGQESTVDLHEQNHLIFPISRKDGVVLRLQGA